MTTTDAALTTRSLRSDPRLILARIAPQLLLVLLAVVLLGIRPSILSGQNLLNVLINAVPTAVLALGAMWVLISGGLDLSAGYGVAMCAMVCGAEIQAGVPTGLAILAALGAGAALGLVNGTLVGLFRIPPFIATLATMAAVQGVTLVLGKVGTVIVSNHLMDVLGLDRLYGVPVIVLVLVGVALIVHYLARYTRFGMHTYAVGSDREASRARGIKLLRLDIMIYVFAGLMTALTGILLVARVQTVDPSIADLNVLLDAFAATILGGTSLFGGRGTVVGTVTGAVFISLVTTSMVSLGVGAQNVQLLKGVMIVVAVVVDAIVRSLQQRAISARRST